MKKLTIKAYCDIIGKDKRYYQTLASKGKVDKFEGVKRITGGGREDGVNYPYLLHIEEQDLQKLKIKYGNG